MVKAYIFAPYATAPAIIQIKFTFYYFSAFFSGLGKVFLWKIGRVISLYFAKQLVYKFIILNLQIFLFVT